MTPDEQNVTGEQAAEDWVQWDPWMGDWFTSWSPRNSNSNAEGQWDHWVDLALMILSDPLTKIVRPDVHDPALAEQVKNFYDEAGRELAAVELRKRFERKEAR
jgi:hypothetical protein